MDVKGGADSRDEWMKEARRHDQSMFRYCEKWQENGTGRRVGAYVEVRGDLGVYRGREESSGGAGRVRLMGK